MQAESNEAGADEGPAVPSVLVGRKEFDD